MNNEPSRFCLERKSSLDSAWEAYSHHQTRDQGREAGQRFKDKYANELRLVDRDGNVLDAWKAG